MKILTVLWWLIHKLTQVFLRSYRSGIQLSPYCDLVCRGFEVAYVPAETLGEISLLCHQGNSSDY
ncbi:MAG: hypothetical protein ACJASL_002743 [Paraglaciecola sp.]|jgi:hypothetical protein